MQNLVKSTQARLVLSLLISFQIGFQPLLASAESSPASTSDLVTENSVKKDLDPIWQQFIEAKPTDFKLSYAFNDPAIDQDPYFMRAQNWNSLQNKMASLTFKKTSKNLEIILPDSQKSLILNLPLTPIQATEEFIFLSLDTSSDLFQKAAGKNMKAGEGIFFLSRADLAQQSADGKPAPIFFFPLAGSGWTGTLSSLHLPQIDSIVIANKTESVAIELRDIETVMKAQQINLLMAQALSAKNSRELTKEMYPHPGMTAAFGLFFTGIDLQDLHKSMWPDLQSQAHLDQSSWFLPLLIPFVKKVSSWFPFAIKPAQAFVLPPELIARMVFVGSVLTGMLAASVVIKYAHPGVRKKLKSLRSVEYSVKNPIKFAGQEIKETFDVFAAVTSTAAQVASVTFANSLELFLDRFMPTVAAADHTLVRRFLNNTFYFSRNSMKNVPVNSRTFVLGALVMGSVDTSMVAVQYEVAVPWMAQAIAPHVGEDMQARIEHTFDPMNPNSKQITLQDTIRNGIAYLQVGASSYSVEAKAQAIENVTKEVEAEMKSRGVNPDNPENQLEKENKINQKINIIMKQKGLPDQSQFQFDASTLFSKIPKTLGYRTPEALQTGESFILERRFGLSKNALDKAILVANEWVKNDPSETSRDALALLEETSRAMSFLKNGLQKGREGLAQARAARQQLTILSYEGSVDYAIKYIPETWSRKYSAQATQTASLLFRQSLYSFLSAEGDQLLFANKNNLEKYGELAKNQALIELKKSYPEKLDWSQLSSELKFELKLRTQIEINRLARAEAVKQKANDFKPVNLDWLARRQQQQAQKITDIQMTEYLKSEVGSKADDSHLESLKQKFFREALAKQIGLHIEDQDVARSQGREDYVKMLDVVHQKAEESTISEIKNNANMSAYFEKLSDLEKAKMQMFLYANNYFQAYKEATTELEMVAPTDSAQPGRFQKLRQTEVVRNSRYLTRTLRTLEAFGDDQSMKLGWAGMLNRNIPLASDLIASHKRLMKTFLSTVTVTYAWNFFAWQIHIPYSAFLLFAVSTAATISTPSMWLNRVFRLNGMKAMDSVGSKIAYSLPYAWVTFAGMFPILLFSGDVSAIFSDYIRTPVLSILERIEVKDWLIGALSFSMIAKAIKSKTQPDFTGQAKAPLQCLSLFN